MEKKHLNQHTTFTRLTAIGLGPAISLPILKCVDNWLVNHGPEWVISRLKNLKVAYLQNIAGKTLTSYDTGFRMHADGTPYGAFRPLFRLLNHKGRIKALNTLMMYSDFTLKNVSEKQWRKFYDSVVNPAEQRMDYQIKITPEMRWSMHDSWSKARYTGLDHWTCTDKRAPLKKTGVAGLITKVESEVSIDDHLAVLDDPLGMDLLMYCPIPYKESCGIEMAPAIKAKRRIYESGSPRFPSCFVGRIGFIQEKGGKLRAIANPYRVHQAALSKLGNALFDFLRTSCPWDCTFDQDHGVRRVQEHLNAGETVYTVDLSDATNQFPLTLQMQVIRELLTEKTVSKHTGSRENAVNHEIKQSLDLFEIISKNKWHIPHLRKDLRDVKAPFQIRWSKGQPLGLYPSFAAFALTHGLLLKTIESSLGLDQTFVVLGDDVAIFHPDVYQEYLTILEGLGCPVSKLKSLTSNKVSEFAGRIITDNGPLPVEKWKPWSKKDCLSVIRQLGVPGVNLVPNRYREVVMKFCSIPEPIGLGMNPTGLPLEKRMEGVEDLFLPMAEQIDIPTYRYREKYMDLAKAFNPYLVQQQLVALRGIVSTGTWSNRPSNGTSLLIEHYNAYAEKHRNYEFSEHLLQLEEWLLYYRPGFTRGKPYSNKVTTMLHHVLDVVAKMWH